MRPGNVVAIAGSQLPNPLSTSSALNASEAFAKAQAAKSTNSESSPSKADYRVRLAVGLSLGLPLIALVAALVILLRTGAARKRREAHQRDEARQNEISAPQQLDGNLHPMSEIDGARHMQELSDARGLQELSGTTGLQELSGESRVVEAPVKIDALAHTIEPKGGSTL
jgi:hypothetical protein